jgi:hypothetical protein
MSARIPMMKDHQRLEVSRDITYLRCKNYNRKYSRTPMASGITFELTRRREFIQAAPDQS